tara:strand:- start:213 stop:728 length:516 start_codon:yes stop_codon:yes gene_type:complete
MLSLAHLYAQGYKTTKGKVTFFSSAPVEDIKAENKVVTGLFDAQTGSLAFLVPINGFRFPKSLMQEHFNEKFMESHKFPTATFDGELLGFNISKAGTQVVQAKGNLTIHGVTVNANISGNIEFREDEVHMKAIFPIKLVDHVIQIPKVLFYNIAEEMEVTVNFVLKKLEEK